MYVENPYVGLQMQQQNPAAAWEMERKAAMHDLYSLMQNESNYSQAEADLILQRAQQFGFTGYSNKGDLARQFFGGFLNGALLGLPNMFGANLGGLATNKAEKSAHLWGNIAGGVADIIVPYSPGKLAFGLLGKAMPWAARGAGAAGSKIPWVGKRLGGVFEKWRNLRGAAGAAEDIAEDVAAGASSAERAAASEAVNATENVAKDVVRETEEKFTAANATHSGNAAGASGVSDVHIAPVNKQALFSRDRGFGTMRRDAGGRGNRGFSEWIKTEPSPPQSGVPRGMAPPTMPTYGLRYSPVNVGMRPNNYGIPMTLSGEEAARGTASMARQTAMTKALYKFMELPRLEQAAVRAGIPQNELAKMVRGIHGLPENIIPKRVPVRDLLLRRGRTGFETITSRPRLTSTEPRGLLNAPPQRQRVIPLGGEVPNSGEVFNMPGGLLGGLKYPISAYERAIYTSSDWYPSMLNGPVKQSIIERALQSAGKGADAETHLAHLVKNARESSALNKTPLGRVLSQARGWRGDIAKHPTTPPVFDKRYSLIYHNRVPPWEHYVPEGWLHYDYGTRVLPRMYRTFPEVTQAERARFLNPYWAGDTESYLNRLVEIVRANGGKVPKNIDKILEEPPTTMYLDGLYETYPWNLH